jgi:hypothetical protein
MWICVVLSAEQSLSKAGDTERSLNSAAYRRNTNHFVTIFGDNIKPNPTHIQEAVFPAWVKFVPSKKTLRRTSASTQWAPVITRPEGKNASYIAEGLPRTCASVFT